MYTIHSVTQTTTLKLKQTKKNIVLGYHYYYYYCVGKQTRQARRKLFIKITVCNRSVKSTTSFIHEYNQWGPAVCPTAPLDVVGVVVIVGPV